MLPKNLSSERDSAASSALWASCHRAVLRLSLWLGPTFQMTLIMLAGATNRVDFYLWATLTIGNAYGLLVLIVERRANERVRRLSVGHPHPGVMRPADEADLRHCPIIWGLENQRGSNASSSLQSTYAGTLAM